MNKPKHHRQLLKKGIWNPTPPFLVQPCCLLLVKCAYLLSQVPESHQGSLCCLEVTNLYNSGLAQYLRLLSAATAIFVARDKHRWFCRWRLKTEKYFYGIIHYSVTAFVTRGSMAILDRLFNWGHRHRINETKSYVRVKESRLERQKSLVCARYNKAVWYERRFLTKI